MAQLKFPTLMIVASTSFFLGLLFSLFPYDYPLLWSAAPIPPSHLDAVESNLKLLYHCPKICFQIFHGMILSNMLFDGGSLVLFMVALIVYISNIAKGLRIVDTGVYGVGVVETPEGYVPEGSGKKGVAWGGEGEGDNNVVGREDNLKVLSASNTILALVLVGVLVLQVGQWYAERQDEKTAKEYAAKEKAERAGDEAEPPTPTTGKKTKPPPFGLAAPQGSKKKN
ncbi:uncharacterized protein AB675_825 [Cyphellophora attinorum]|uniref:Secretory component protein SHR3 n=1 Tax=Cyphellophora attinorum TaxID=1664694 RepID=A0A0N0NRU0_9EURO|nr:uncharacterized protein AB675_825 [Phialophora attinorum]KPI45481.1 hypothetical protein AB675_825 [Phialophora attinorum]